MRARDFRSASRLAPLLAVLAAGGTARAQFSIGQAASPTPPPIHDIKPPLDVFPYPMWMVATAGAIALVLLILVVTLIVRAFRNRPKTPPPTPREIALRKLVAAEAGLEREEPYAFSIRVSDILRQYVSAQYKLHATEQTSPEFLADAAKSPHFTGGDKQLLAEFLERCDLIKFAHIDATTADSKALLAQAVRFVKGGDLAPGVQLSAGEIESQGVIR